MYALSQPASSSVLAPAADNALPQVFGRYLLVDRVSRGGMGEIFLAKHGLAGFEKLAVIKKVLPHLSSDDQFISRFVDEAKVAIKLQHNNIAQVFEVGRVGDEYFLALEYIEGRDLRRMFSLLTQRGHRLPPDLALFIARELANGMAYAHRRTGADGSPLNLVHCDISPPNVLTSFEGEIKVIDFGIAKSALRGTATDPKMGFGKFGYMAPEQLIRGGVVDQRTDIYAVGVVLYELLTCQRLYEVGEAPDYRALARAVSKGEHPLPSDVFPALAEFDEIVSIALSPRPEDRFQTAAEFRDAIASKLAVVNPTISTDQLGEFLRDLFSDELAQQRDVKERIANTHLADFEIALSTQAIETISFASAPPEIPGRSRRRTQVSERIAVPNTADGAGSALAHRATSPAAALPSGVGAIGYSNGAHSGAGMMQDTLSDLPAVQARPRRRLVAVAAIAGLLLAGAVFAMTQPSRNNRKVAAAPIANVNEQQQNANPPHSTETITPITSIDVATDAAMTGIATPTTAQEPELAPVLVPARRGRDVVRASSKPNKPAVLTRAQVDQRFAMAVRDYKAFKTKFGGRLETDWGALAAFVQYQTNPEQFEGAIRRIDAFRAQIKAAESSP
jgi:serine/threonine protein kinase